MCCVLYLLCIIFVLRDGVFCFGCIYCVVGVFFGMLCWYICLMCVCYWGMLLDEGLIVIGWVDVVVLVELIGVLKLVCELYGLNWVCRMCVVGVLIGLICYVMCIILKVIVGLWVFMFGLKFFFYCCGVWLCVVFFVVVIICVFVFVFVIVLVDCYVCDVVIVYECVVVNDIVVFVDCILDGVCFWYVDELIVLVGWLCVMVFWIFVEVGICLCYLWVVVLVNDGCVMCLLVFGLIDLLFVVYVCEFELGLMIVMLLC